MLLVGESVFGCIRTVSCPKALDVVSEKDLKCYLALSQEEILYHCVIPQHGLLALVTTSLLSSFLPGGFQVPPQ